MRLCLLRTFVGALAASLSFGAAAQERPYQVPSSYLAVGNIAPNLADASGLGPGASPPSAMPPGPCPGGGTRCSEGRTWFGTIYGDREAPDGLWDDIANFFTGDFKFKNEYFVGEGLSYVAVHDLQIPIPFTRLMLPFDRIEIEGQLAQHFGKALGTEGLIGAVLRSRDLSLPGGFTVNFAVGDGPSVFFTKAADEKPDRKFLNCLLAEVEFGSEQVPWLHVLPQLHHRSGIFGLMAPSAAGSNYFGIGVRVDIE